MKKQRKNQLRLPKVRFCVHLHPSFTQQIAPKRRLFTVWPHWAGIWSFTCKGSIICVLCKLNLVKYQTIKWQLPSDNPTECLTHFALWPYILINFAAILCNQASSTYISLPEMFSWCTHGQTSYLNSDKSSFSYNFCLLYPWAHITTPIRPQS